MACFRQHGFEATSVRDLEATTGLKATSLYNAFGNKAGLSNAALARYHRDVVERRINEHLRPALGVAGIRSFFVSTYMVEPLPAHGCLIANSAVEFASLDVAARHAVTESLASMRAALARLLETAQRSGQVDTAIDTDAVAGALLVLYEGLLVLLRTGTATADLTAAIDAALTALTPPKQKASRKSQGAS